ncbi:outer membrane beta-barrel protein [Solitalea lacus]|uniref:outer membrane beta-barrel protein n=1 Tax=Solitalea lacus TaxID=2911172 RepID=UPI001EDB78B3|nr:outer membrane beta-barrel protein [Solitalea lacus]UKJ07605.1 PorT family protein [Solitalea lacus]
MKEKKSVDELLKQGLEPDTPAVFNEQQWYLLEKRLDKHDRNKRTMLWLGVAGGIAASLLLILGLFKLFTPDNFQEPRIVKQQKVGDGKSASSNIPGKGQISRGTASNTTKEDKELNVSNSQQVKLGTNELFLLKTDSSKINELTNITSISNKTALVDTGKSKKPEMSLGNEMQSNSISSIAQSSFKDAKKTSDFGRFTFSVGAAPALNGVNSFKDASFGGDFGIGVSMSLSKRWSVSTGAVYAKMVYSTGFENYKPSNPLSFNYSPQSIDADCRVLDIPLNLHYKVLDKNKNRITLGAGLSSYIMLREEYKFNYAYSSPSDPKYYEVNNQNKHWFSVANFQLQYDRKISPTTSIGIQPFVKVPLDGVGYSQVKLQSVGVAVKFNFDLNKNKKTTKGN